MLSDFCTLFDVNFLPRGLVLYRSLAQVCPDLRLRVFCMDEPTRTVLDRMALPGLIPIGLEELEAHDAGLLEVKPTRTRAEYCWTATPAVCLYALEREPGLQAITYLDADLMFFSDPGVLFAELGDDSVLITPHRYSPRWQGNEAPFGRYNIQLVTFRRDERGLNALRWWRERCLEWCYDRTEDGRYGDQKYLDDWSQRFPGVRVLEHVGGGLAPWNVANYRLERAGATVLVDGRPLVFYHYSWLELYHRLGAVVMALFSRGYGFVRRPVPLVWATPYFVSPSEMDLVFVPYVKALSHVLADVRRVAPGFEGGLRTVPMREVGRRIARRLHVASSERVPEAATSDRPS